MKRKNDMTREYRQAFYRGNRMSWAAAMACTLLSPAGMLFSSWMLAAILDATAALDKGRLMELLWMFLGLLAVLPAMDLAKARAKALFLRRAMEQYKSLAFEKLSEKSISAFARENTGRYISVLTNDAAVVEEQYLGNSFNLIFQAAQFAGGLVMMCFYSPLLTLGAVLLCLLPLSVSLLMGGGLAVREKAVSDRNEDFVSMVKDLLTGFAVVKSFKAEKEVRTRFDKTAQVTEGAKFARRWWDGLLNVAGNTSGEIMQFGVFFLGAFLAVRGDITPGTVILFVNLCNCLINPVAVIPQYLAQRKAAHGLMEKLAQAVEENAGRTGEAIPPVLTDAIRLADLSFGYEGDKPVLKDVDMTLEAGKKYALVGGSGSGKSTLLNLLMGAYDSYGGSVTVDGKELREIDPDSLYDLESLIGQNVFLFDDTIRQNITMFKDFPDDEVDSAARRSGLAPLLEEKGADYLCGENGNNLSGGERQRVSIARCLLRKTPVLLLDEATAALDNQTAFRVVDDLLKLEGVTRLVVTHRLERELLEQYDRIFVLKNGTVQEQGTFEELMADKGTFYSLYTLSA